jgi:hypothetical protein
MRLKLYDSVAFGANSVLADSWTTYTKDVCAVAATETTYDSVVPGSA